MREFCERAYSIFASDYKNHPERYVAGELPSLPFADSSFDLTLVSYFLFAYQDRLTYQFHAIRSLKSCALRGVKRAFIQP